LYVGSVADPDPGSGAFLTLGSGISFFPDPGFWITDPTHIYESLVISVSIDSNIFLSLFKKLDNFLFCEIYGHLFFVGSEIRDLGSRIRDGKKSGFGIWDKHPGSATLYVGILGKVTNLETMSNTLPYPTLPYLLKLFLL
jgi:hypothetical protein